MGARHHRSWLLREEHNELRVRARSLELISPEGDALLPLCHDQGTLENHVDPSNFSLISWDPVARTALLKRYVSVFRAQAIRLDLETGASQTLALPKNEMATGLRPDGAGVLSQTFSGRFLSIAWDGRARSSGRPDHKAASSPRPMARPS